MTQDELSKKILGIEPLFDSIEEVLEENERIREEALMYANLFIGELLYRDFENISTIRKANDAEAYVVEKDHRIIAYFPYS